MLRLATLLMFCGGLGLVVHPISLAPEVVPFVGGLLAGMIGCALACAAFLVGLACFLLVTAIGCDMSCSESLSRMLVTADLRINASGWDDESTTETLGRPWVRGTASALGCAQQQQQQQLPMERDRESLFTCKRSAGPTLTPMGGRHF